MRFEVSSYGIIDNITKQSYNIWDNEFTDKKIESRILLKTDSLKEAFKFYANIILKENNYAYGDGEAILKASELLRKYKEKD